jgi:hypothetical protein
MSEQSTSSAVWEGLRPHLVHDIGAVDFDGDFADADLAGNLLVHETVSDQTDQFAFASRQFFEVRPLIAVTALSFSGLMRSLVECELN